MQLVSKIIGDQKVVPVVVIEDEIQARGLSQALLNGGISVIEVTLRNQYGLDAITLIKQEFPDMVVLAGTVNSKNAMQQVVAAGVDGIISPGLTPELLETAQDLDIPYLPGVATGSEILTALQYGLSECKLFPASIVGGIPALKAFAGPFSDMRFCPTGGVSSDNYKDYLALPNVMCVGGSWLAPTKLVAAGDWDAISDLCRAVS